MKLRIKGCILINDIKIFNGIEDINIEDMVSIQYKENTQLISKIGFLESIYNKTFSIKSFIEIRDDNNYHTTILFDDIIEINKVGDNDE